MAHSGSFLPHANRVSKRDACRQRRPGQNKDGERKRSSVADSTPALPKTTDPGVDKDVPARELQNYPPAPSSHSPRPQPRPLTFSRGPFEVDRW